MHFVSCSIVETSRRLHSKACLTVVSVLVEMGNGIGTAVLQARDPLLRTVTCLPLP